MSTIYETFPTQRNFLVQPTGAGGSSQIEYQGTQGTVNSLFQTTGTGTWTFQLPRPLQYQLQVGTQFTFQNLSTGLLTITADDGSTVGTVVTGTQIQVTMKDVGNTSSSWAIISSPSTAYSGVLPVANGGTGNTSIVTSPTANTIPAYDANAALHAKTFVDSVVDYTGSSVTFTNATLPAVVMIKAGGGSTSYTLPNETTSVNGTRTRFINISTADNITVLTIYGGVNVLPPGYMADYEFIVDNTSGKHWIGYSRPITNISNTQQLSLDATYTRGSTIMNVPYTGFTPVGDGHTYRNYYQPGSNANVYDPVYSNPKYYLNQAFPFNYNMTVDSSKVTVINNFYYAGDPFHYTSPVIFLPDVTTITVGSTYEFYIQNINLGAVQFWTSKANGNPLQCLGLTDGNTNSATGNIRAVCLSNDAKAGKKAWFFGTQALSTSPDPLQVIEVAVNVVTALVPFFGQAVALIESFGVIAEEVVIDVAANTTLALPEVTEVCCSEGIAEGLPAYSLGNWSENVTTVIDAPPSYSVFVKDVLGNPLGTVPAGGHGAVYVAAWGTDVPFLPQTWALATAA